METHEAAHDMGININSIPRGMSVSRIRTARDKSGPKMGKINLRNCEFRPEIDKVDKSGPKLGEIDKIDSSGPK